MKIEINVERKYLYFLIGVLILLAVSVLVYSATTGKPKNAMGHQTLYADNIESYSGSGVNIAGSDVNIDSVPILLARGTDYTEEAILSMSSSGVTSEVDSTYADQRLNDVIFKWPSTKVKKIYLVANLGLRSSEEYNFCAGSEGVLDIDAAGAGTKPLCTSYKWKGTTLTKSTGTYNNFIRLSINGVSKTNCPSSNSQEVPESGYPGRESHSVYGAICVYDFDSTLTSLTLEEAQWDNNYGPWNWEIWYIAGD